MASAAPASRSSSRTTCRSVFRLDRALFVLDGAVQYNKQDDTGALAAQKEIPIFSGSVPPGDHTLQVLLAVPWLWLRRVLVPAGLPLRGEVEPLVHGDRGQDSRTHGHRLRKGRRHHAGRAAPGRSLRREAPERHWSFAATPLRVVRLWRSAPSRSDQEESDGGTRDAAASRRRTARGARARDSCTHGAGTRSLPASSW